MTKVKNDEFEIKTKAQRRKDARQLVRYVKGNYGPDDGSFRPSKKQSKIIEMIKEEGLEQDFINDKNIKL